MSKEALEGNRLIAEFDGVTFEIIDKVHYLKDRHDYFVKFPSGACFKKYGTIEDVIKACDFKYHTSWDWLMPVVEKINSIAGYDVIIWKNDCHINDEREILFENGRRKDEQLLSVVWRTVIQFINHYNQTQKR